MNSVDLVVSVPRLLQVKVNIANLLVAVAKRATAELLLRLLEGADGDLDMVAKATEGLQANGLVVDQSDDQGLTPFGRSLLFDGDRSFEDSLQPLFEYSGYDAARRRIALFANDQLDQSRVAETSRVVCDLEERLDQDVHSMQDRRRLVTELMRRLFELRDAIAQARTMNDQQLSALERDRDNLRQPRQPETEVSSSLGALKNRASELVGKFRTLLRSQSTTVGNSVYLLGSVEKELLGLHLRSIVLSAEELSVNDVMRELSAEEDRGDQSMALIRAEIQALQTAAEQVSISRGWSVASGEICLNSESLTQVAVATLDSEGLSAQFGDRYRERHDRDVFSETNGMFGKTDIDEIEQIVYECVQKRLDWNAVDCLVALIEDSGGTRNALREAVRQISERDFLAVGYAGYLRHNTFAAIAYAPGRTPKANQIFPHLLEDLRRVLGTEVNEYIDGNDLESVGIYIEDRAIPLTAMQVYDDSLYEAYDIRNDPHFTPHPEIYTSSTCDQTTTKANRDD